MSPQLKTVILTAVLYVVYAIFVWLLSGWMGLVGWRTWVFRGLMWALGLTASVLWVWYSRKRRKAARASADPEVDQALRAANTKLAASKLGKKASLQSIPVVVVLGPNGVAKTTTVVQSELEPELLAGEVYRGEVVAPTRGVNVWVSGKAAVVEAGSPMIADPGRWQNLARRLRAKRWRTILTGAPMAPRAAVLCVGCDALAACATPNDGARYAADLRDRLVELSQALSVPLPVYVMITKLDTVKHFEQFIQRFSNAEVKEAFGATLRMKPAAAGGWDAQSESRLFTEMLHRLYRSAAAMRTESLQRETDERAALAAYEFPREFRKLTSATAAFLTELSRPSELQASHFVRGFYFSGVRPIVVTGQAAPAAQAAPSAVNATMMLGQTPAAPAAAPQASTPGRRVPQWVFNKTVFRRVLLADQAALKTTQGGVDVALVRRFLLAAVAVLAVAGTFVTARSFFRNRGVIREAQTLATALGAMVRHDPDLPPTGTLDTLDLTRSLLVRLAEERRTAPPLSWRWGMYTGDKVYDELRPRYLTGLETVLLTSATSGLTTYMQSLPAEPDPSADFGATYDRLKAYLMLTSDPDRIDGSLPATLVTTWVDGRPIDPDRRAQVSRQFEYYAEGLCDPELCARPADPQLVARTRNYLFGFGDTDREYQSLLSRVSETIEPVSFAAAFPNAGNVVRNTYVVPGAFTKPGWERVHAELSRDDFAGAEDWVLGDAAPSQRDQTAQGAVLLQRYKEEYAAQWRDYVAAASIPRWSVRAGGSALNALGSNESPILQMLSVAAENTYIDSTTTVAGFQPVQVVVTPGAQRFVNDANGEYIRALQQLESAFADFARTPSEPSNADAVRTAAGSAQGAIDQMASSFNVDGMSADVGRALQRLMAQPLQNSRRELGRGVIAASNRRSAQFCQAIEPIIALYPFRSANNEASAEQISGFLAPGTGSLFNFIDTDLAGDVRRVGDRYERDPGASVPVRADFLDFLTRAHAASDAFYSAPQQGNPGIQFTFQADFPDNSLTQVDFIVDGRVSTFTPNQRTTQPFTWTIDDIQVELRAVTSANQEISRRYSNDWALFRLFASATWRGPTASGYTAEWRLSDGGAEVRIQANVRIAGGAPAIWSGDYFDGFACVRDMSS